MVTLRPLFFFSHGPRLNTEAYIKYLEEVMLPWIKKETAGRPYVGQQHYATQAVSENLCY